MEGILVRMGFVNWTELRVRNCCSTFRIFKRALHEKYREEEDFSRKGAKGGCVSKGFLCAFAALREKQFSFLKCPGEDLSTFRKAPLCQEPSNREDPDRLRTSSYF